MKRIILAKPRGFCAGVERAIRSVEQALAVYGPPVYVLNAIVHNETVVQGLRGKGAVFVRDLNDVPHGSHLLFSAHGVGLAQWAAARERGLHVIDATCPLVEKVHREARRFAEDGCAIILIGEKGHDEVVGTAGWAPDHIQVVFSEEEAATVSVPDPDRVAYLTQTTLSVEDASRVIEALRRRFPAIRGPQADDICYATQNRQRAVIELAPQADLVLVVGDPASANSKRLAEICGKKGKPSHLIASALLIQDAWLQDAETVLVTSGASVPESLVRGVVEHLAGKGFLAVEEHEVAHENVHFGLPEAFKEDH
ncbi:MAG TPA: 4-hydroxy-3-methylbut-2-enyl diphosphate reductase [Candidatus Hydrogenedentes bacterium]|nr:4-hydroxy-3-methylbut-2-enyl diphosphate reductase [Candidatus Hydrogenedentota bacterium]HRT18511.1 4-hydroxy-3-methylbut-2-enyl diphosphate reductase [Candidatus Hydrogenedentota bacterium]HRT63530.1 4-hydroxy-3-methylbut-2-enyl diphosphate reductase [Candidatus Hydrogenedentota bacterium]